MGLFFVIPSLPMSRWDYMSNQVLLSLCDVIFNVRKIFSTSFPNTRQMLSRICRMTLLYIPPCPIEPSLVTSISCLCALWSSQECFCCLTQDGCLLRCLHLADTHCVWYQHRHLTCWYVLKPFQLHSFTLFDVCVDHTQIILPWCSHVSDFGL